MENDYLQGRNNYPTIVSTAYHLLINWKQDPRLGLHEVGPISHEVSFNTIYGGDSILLNNGERGRQKVKANVTCNKCQKKGHYANECNEDKPPATSTPSAEPSIENQTAKTLLMDGESNGEFNRNLHFQFFQVFNQAIETLNDEVIMQIGSDGKLPKSWILLDNQFTVDLFYNKERLINIRKQHKKLDIHCNAVIATTTLIGNLPGYGTVWYNANIIANILSLARVKEHGYRVTYDSSEEGNAFHVHKSDGTVRVFEESDKGLYYMDTKTQQNNDNIDVTLVNMVDNNHVKYSQRDYSKAVLLALKIQKIIG